MEEIILATTPVGRGDRHLPRRGSEALGMRITRIARGLPVGGDLEYADGDAVQGAEGRREVLLIPFSKIFLVTIREQ